ncbi:MAG: hypothetical protein JXQ73_09160 [Phycisphaerae bacterium]|nr:hypothetical protein [Phycisphaerae bacterium]
MAKVSFRFVMAGTIVGALVAAAAVSRLASATAAEAKSDADPRARPAPVPDATNVAETGARPEQTLPRPKRDRSRFAPGPAGPKHAPPGQGRTAATPRGPSEWQIEQGMTFLQEQWPERHAMMLQLQVDDPQAFALAFRNIWPQMAKMIELHRNKPELAEVEIALVKLEFEIRRVARSYHMAARKAGLRLADEPEETEGLPESLKDTLASLKDLIAQRFDLEIKRAELRIQELSEQLNEQRERLEQRRQSKQEEVDRLASKMISKKFPPRRIRDEGPGGRGERRPDRLRPGGRGRGGPAPAQSKTPGKPTETPTSRPRG